CAQVFFNQVGVLAYSFRERTEDNTDFFELFAKGRGNRYRIKNGINGYARQARALVKRDTQFFVCTQQFRVDLVQTFGSVGFAFRRRVIANVLKVDRWKIDMSPMRVLHGQPLSISLQTPFEHEFWFLLYRR